MNGSSENTRLIRQVLVQAQSDTVSTARLTLPKEGERFAFYVYEDGKKVITKSYCNEPSISFKTSPGTTYSVDGFIESSDGTRTRITGAPFTTTPITPHSEKQPHQIGQAASASNCAQLADGTYEFEEGEFTFSALIRKKKQKRLFVLLSAAIDRRRATPPVFNRWKWSSKFPGTVVCIADPSLDIDDTYELGWYLGTQDYDATEALARLVYKISNALEIEPKDIIFYGSSGGGFAAISAALRTPGSTAVAINAQTDPLKYEIKRSVSKMLKVFLGDKPIDRITEDDLNRISIIEKLKHTPAQARLILVQNKLDTHHYNTHFAPLCVSLDIDPEHGGPARSGTHHALVYSHPNGHGPEPAEYFDKIIELATTRSPAPIK